jgi:hypothetical protein
MRLLFASTPMGTFTLKCQSPSYWVELIPGSRWFVRFFVLPGGGKDRRVNPRAGLHEQALDGEARH